MTKITEYKDWVVETNFNADVAIANIKGTGMNFGAPTEDEATEEAIYYINKYYLKRITYQTYNTHTVIRRNHRDISVATTVKRKSKIRQGLLWKS